MLTIVVNSVFRFVPYKLQQLESSYLVHVCTYMFVAAAIHNCMTLTYMSRLTDFAVCHCFGGIF